MSIEIVEVSPVQIPRRSMWPMDMGPYIFHRVYFVDWLDNGNRQPLCEDLLAGMFEYKNTITAEHLLHIPLNILIVEFPI